MKKILGMVFPVMFLIGILVICVGGISIFLNHSYLRKVARIQTEGKRSFVMIREKGTSDPGAGTSRYSSEYFYIDYLGPHKEKDYTIIHPAAEEFEKYKEGVMVEVCYDPRTPDEAYFPRSDRALQILRVTPLVVILVGCFIVSFAALLSRFIHKNNDS